MRIGRTLPPTAAPIEVGAIVSGICGLFRGQRELDRFELELKEYFGFRHCFVVSSGKAAFTLILLALKELCPDRNEVLLPAFTCYSVPSSVVRAELRIRLCDQHPDSFDFDFSQLSAMLLEDLPPKVEACSEHGASEWRLESREAAEGSQGSTSRILAVVPTHLFGYPADVAKLRNLIRDPDIAIIEDAAQAMGETIEERKVGTLGDVSFFSLARGKAFSVVEGGVVLTDRNDVAEILDRLVNKLPRYGLFAQLKLIVMATALMLLIHPMLFWIPRSIPFLKLGETVFETDFPILKMSSFQAGLTRNWQRRLDKLREIRKDKVNRWTEILETSRNHRLNVFGSRSLGLLRFPLKITDEKKRGTLLKESAGMGLGVMPAYPTSINLIPELRGRIQGGEFPVAERFARQLVTLPTHGYVTQKDMTSISRLLLHADS